MLIVGTSSPHPLKMQVIENTLNNINNSVRKDKKCRNDNVENLAPPRGYAFPPLCKKEGERKTALKNQRMAIQVFFREAPHTV